MSAIFNHKRLLTAVSSPNLGPTTVAQTAEEEPLFVPNLGSIFEKKLARFYEDAVEKISSETVRCNLNHKVTLSNDLQWSRR
jgi:hypothetical protein